MNEKIVVREWYDEDNDITYCIRFVKINDTGILMQSVTLPGGDVTQVPYEGETPYPYNLYSFN